MTRMSKQDKRRAVSPRRPRLPSKETGPLKDNLPEGYRVHENAVEGDSSKQIFIGKIR